MDMNHLLNFRTSTPSNLPSTSSPFPNNNSSRKINKNHHNRNCDPKGRQSRQSQRREKQTREKLSSSFYLHSSPSYAFVITRIGASVGEKGVNNSVRKDNEVKWDKVKIVKSFVTLEPNSSSSPLSLQCAICLDSFTSPRITECGHTFCYSCILHHFYCNLHNTNTQIVQPQRCRDHVDLSAKCPCCSHIIYRDQLKPVQFITVQSPKYQKGITKFITFRKIYRMRESSVPFIPSCPNSSYDHQEDAGSNRIHILKRIGTLTPKATDADAYFCRFNYLDVPLYLQHLKNDMSSIQQQLKESTMAHDSGKNNSTDNGASYLTLALQAVEVEYAIGVADGIEEQKLNDVFHEEQKKYLIDVIPYEHHQYPMKDDATGDDDRDARLPHNMDTNEDAKRGHLQSNNGRKNSYAENEKKGCNTLKPLLNPGTMYLEPDCVQFYQSSDGQLCFLSGFNMNCLSYDFATTKPSDLSSLSQDVHVNSIDATSRTLPFPDEIRGRIIDVEQVHLTPEVVKRMSFLSHLPLYTDVTFVEIDLNQLLSPTARKIVRVEVERRRKKRQAKRNIERKECKAAQKREERRIENLKRDLQYHSQLSYVESGLSSQASLSSDGNNFHTETSFFEGEEFGPTLTLAQNDTALSQNDSRGLTSPSPSLPSSTSYPPNGTDPVLSFRSVCASNGVFPPLQAAAIEQSFPPLGSKSSSRLERGGWGASRSTSSIQTSNSNNDNSSESGASGRSSLTSLNTKKKGSRGKKVILFSTGGHRGRR